MAETLGNFLTRRMGDEIALLREFVAILRREQEALTTDDTDEIAAASEAKGSLFRQLGQISTERNLALAREGFGTNRAGFDAFIRRHDDSGVLAQLRDRLMSTAGEANELNHINGKLISLRMTHNQRSLATLLGNSETSSTYGRDGRSNLGGHAVGRRLTTA